MSLALFLWLLRREKYCVSTQLGVSNAYLRTRVSTQFSVKLRHGRVFGEAVDFTDRLFFSLVIYSPIFLFSLHVSLKKLCLYENWRSGSRECVR